MLCGIFGNVDEADIKNVIASLPGLVVGGGTVIWTRGASEPDMRPRIREWCDESGLVEVSFDGDPAPFGVGVNRKPCGPPQGPAKTFSGRLFTFVR
jgi:hypothetical protein